MNLKQALAGSLPRLLGLKTSLDLTPAGTLRPDKSPDSAPSFTWQAPDEEGYFLASGRMPMPGFNMLEIDIEHDQPSAAAAITFDYGNGFETRDTLYLAVRRGRVAKRICFIPRGIKGIRLDPLSGQKGSFSVNRCRFIWLTPTFARSRMVRRLNYADRHFQGAGEEQIVAALKQESREERISWKRLLIAYYESTFARGAPSFSYALWQEQIEPLREPSANRVAIAIGKLLVSTRFGVLVSGAASDLDGFKATLDSLLAQRYSQWCLLVTTSQYAHSELKAVLDDYCQQHEQFSEHLVVQPEGNGDCRQWLTALAAPPDYLTVLQAGDCLATNATYHYAAHAQQHPEAELLYGDEDRLEDGVRTLPNFKPGWNPELLLSVNYIGRAAAFALPRLLEFDTWLSDIDRLDLHALLLAFTRELTTEQISQIAYVVLHRPYRQSTAYQELTPNGSGYSVSAVSHYMANNGHNARVSEHSGVGCQTHWPLPDPQPSVSLLVPTRDMLHMLKPCIDRILALTDYQNYEVVILDNQSAQAETLDYLEQIQQDARVRVLHWDHPFNYSAINNFGVANTQSDIVGLVNNDIEPISPGWLKEMVSHAIRPNIGCVGAKLYYPNDTVQHGGVILGLGGVAGHAHRFFPRGAGGFQNRLLLTQYLSAVTAACLLVKRELYERAQGLEEHYLPVAYNDVDLCLKIRELGYRNLWTPYAELYHHESVSRGIDDNPVKKARAKREVDYFRSRWADKLLHDPAYNPNLTVSFEDFSLR